LTNRAEDEIITLITEQPTVLDELDKSESTGIMLLALNANCQHWMFQHPDGRLAVGYRTGNNLIRKAMPNPAKMFLNLVSILPIKYINSQYVKPAKGKSHLQARL
jgi:hypothetical protein